MKLLIVILAFGAFAAINLPDLIRNRQWRDLVAYSAVFVPVLALAVLLAVGVQVPSPIKAIQSLYRDVLGLSFPKS